MKKLGMLSIIVAGMFLGGCSDDDKEFQLDTNRMTGVDWYYNGGTSGNRLSFTDENVLDINRFDKNGEIRGLDIRGQVDTIAGVWSDEGLNTLAVEWKNGTTDKWTVLKCNSSDFTVTNKWGKREYVSKPSYLQNLTGDAFWVNYFDGDASKTKLGFQVSGNTSLRAGYVYALLSDDKSGQIELENNNNIWRGEVANSVENRRVRFSCRVGSKNYVKFDERITDENFAPMRLSDVAMKITKITGSNQLEISWNEFAGENVCYKMEVYLKNNVNDVYFESALFPYVNNYPLSESTVGKVNRLKDIDSRKEYEIRLTAVMLEPGVAYNTTIAENRVQAAFYVTDKFNW
jgi:lipoprotein